MVREKIKKECVEISTNKLDGNLDIGDGETVYVHIVKYYRQGEVDWRIDAVSTDEIEIGGEIDERNAKLQVVISGDYELLDSGRFSVNNITQIDESHVEKDREQVKEVIVELWKICQPTTYITTGNEDNRRLVDIHGELTPHTEIDSGERLDSLRASDFKITTKYSESSSFHLGYAAHSNDYQFKLGVDWKCWHTYSATRLVVSLTHELCHCVHMHHRGEFWVEHARMINRILSSETSKQYVEQLLDRGEIDWDRVKTKTLNGPHRQPKEIDTTGYRHRRSAVNDVVNEMEDIIGYRLVIGKTFHTQPPWKDIFLSFVSNVDDDVWEKREVRNLEFEADRYTDDELYDLLDEELTGEGTTLYDCTSKQLPVVEDGEVIENEWVVALADRMINESDILVENQVPESVTVPVQIQRAAEVEN